MTTIDHAAEARAFIAESVAEGASPWDLADKQERWMTDALIATAQVHATLALVEQQRIIAAELRGFASGSESARASLMRDAADEIERLRGEGVWEYGNEQHMHTRVGVFPAASEATARAQAWLFPMYRRRPAGPWERVPEEAS